MSRNINPQYVRAYLKTLDHVAERIEHGYEMNQRMDGSGELGYQIAINMEAEIAEQRVRLQKAWGFDLQELQQWIYMNWNDRDPTAQEDYLIPHYAYFDVGYFLGPGGQA